MNASTDATIPDPVSTPDGGPERSLAERYRVLLDIGRTLTGTLEPEELYRRIHEETRRVLVTEGFYIALYDASRDEATIVYYVDRGDEQWPDVTYEASKSEVFRTGEGFIVREREERQPVLVLGDDETEMTRSAVGAPLRYKGRVVGCISAQSYRPDAYGRDDLELLEGIADLAAVALENARYVAEVKKRRREAEKIEEIGRALAASLETEEILTRVVEAALELLETDGATVWLLEGGGGRVAKSRGEVALSDELEVEIPESLVARLRDRRETLVLRDIPEDPLLPDELKERLETRSALVVPVAVGTSVVGALSVGDTDAREFSRDEIRILQSLASQASVALENARLHERLQNLSLTDPLTGLPNRRHLELELNREFAAAKRGRHLTVVLFDLDHFKEYNDAHGHVAGDEALRAFAEVLSDETRAMNLVARYGGDEFVSVLSDSSYEGARIHADRVRERVRNHSLLGPADIGVSWGAAEYGPDVDTISDLIRAADRNLYVAKDAREDAGAGRSAGG